MARFWDARAREDAWYFVDNRLAYRRPDAERFWEDGRRDLDLLMAIAGTEVRADDVVVEIGCGLGRLTRVLAERAAHVHALDVSPEMVRRARELSPALDNVTWLVGNGADLTPVADASADAVVSHVVFQHIPDPAVTLGYVREMGRVLRPGGWAAFQLSNDPGLHQERIGTRNRVKAALRRAPKGQDEPEWLGSAVDLQDVEAAAKEGGLDIAKVVGEGTQFCFVRAVRR